MPQLRGNEPILGLNTLIEISFLHTMASNNGEEIKCQSYQEMSGMALDIVLE
jgi:hypothetical protein